jgi:cation:H+ antiporter
MDAVLLLLSFAVILAGALLFTNAVEWIGHRLELGEGAVGSLLAAVGTAMPETLIAIVALIGATEGADQVAIGAIVGAPFLLATLAMGLVGLFAYLYRDRREQGVELTAHRPTLERDLIFFLAFFALSLALGWGAPDPLRIAVGILVILAYPLYIARTLRAGGEVQDEETLNPLVFERRSERREDPGLQLCVVQLLVGLGASRCSISPRASASRPSFSPLSSPHWPRSCRRRSTASSGFATARTHWLSATSAERWSSSRRSRLGSASSSPIGT